MICVHNFINFWFFNLQTTSALIHKKNKKLYCCCCCWQSVLVVFHIYTLPYACVYCTTNVGHCHVVLPFSLLLLFLLPSSLLFLFHFFSSFLCIATVPCYCLLHSNLLAFAFWLHILCSQFMLFFFSFARILACMAFVRRVAQAAEKNSMVDSWN